MKIEEQIGSLEPLTNSWKCWESTDDLKAAESWKSAKDWLTRKTSLCLFLEASPTVKIGVGAPQWYATAGWCSIKGPHDPTATCPDFWLPFNDKRSPVLH